MFYINKTKKNDKNNRITNPLTIIKNEKIKIKTNSKHK